MERAVAHQPLIELTSPLSRLDGRALAPALERRVLIALDEMWAMCSLEDRRILHSIGSFLLDEGSRLDEIRRRSSNASQPEHFRDDHPVSSALLEYGASAGFEGLVRLLSIAVAAGLEASAELDRKRVSRLTQNIRGALENRSSALRLILQDARSLSSMVREVDARIQRGDGVLHKEFAKAWGDWIRDRIFKWMQDDPEAMRVSLRPTFLVPDLDGAQVGLGSGCESDPEDQAAIPIAMTEPEPPGRERAARAICAKAWAQGLSRTSQGDLSVPADQMAPTEVVVALVRAAVAAAEQALARDAPLEAEPFVALLLALATGVRELDLSLLVWGESAAGRLAVIDPSKPVLHRTVMRPANAVRPGASLEDWLVPSTEEIEWPLPPTLHRLLLRIAPATGVRTGAPVLPLLTAGFRRRYRLWDVANEVAPELGLAPSQVRLALASELANEFGPEVAQMLFGDTFSMSAGPAYYTATSADAVATTVARIQQRWFGEKSPVPQTGQLFGSRLILTAPAAQAWPTSLRRQLKSLAHSKAATVGFELWVAHRNHLASALTAVTGARPGDWIAGLDLDQVIPEYGLVLISDKASDQLRETRVAATGLRWLADLRTYLDRLVAIGRGELGPVAADLANAILRSEAPLFSVATPSGSVQQLNAATLRATMPEPLQTVPNHTRHRLNQALQERKVSHEPRHAQLGWVVSPAHILADLSHWSARAMGQELADVLDEILVGDGWYPASQRTAPWTWRDVPDRPLKDWDAEVKAYAARHEANIRRTREALRARWDDVTPAVLTRLTDAFVEYFPTLRLDADRRRLVHASGVTGAGAVEITSDHHALLCDRVRQGDNTPGDATEAIATRIHLYRLIRAARKKGVVKGPLPTRPFLSVTSDPSPFLPGLGLAVRHAEAFRKALLARCDLQRPHDQGPAAAWMVAAFSATRTLDRALGAVGAAASTQRPAGRDDLVRVPAVVDARLCPMVFGGLPALALTKRGTEAPTAKAPSEEHLGQWVLRALELPFVLSAESAEGAGQVAALLQAAGRVELSGPERTVMLGDAPLAAVSVSRSLAKDDDWPVCNALPKEDVDRMADVLYEPESGKGGEDGGIKGKARSPAREYERLTVALDPERFPRLLNRKSDGKTGWRQALAAYLAKLHGDVGETTNPGLLVGYIRHRLRYGGRVKSELAHATLGSDLTRFGSDLLAVAGDDRIADWEAVEFYGNYLATMLCKPTTARRQCFDALMNFHEYLRQVHQAPEIDEAALRAFAGARFVHVDPGMVTRREIEQVYGVLRTDLEAEQALPDATPEAVRLLELREIMYLILEASGLRPSSAYGFTLGDLWLLKPGRDFVRVRITGEFGRAKSNASLGFIPFEGALWASARERVVAWVAQEKARLKNRDWWKLPLFAATPGARRRFSREHLKRRIDQLLKWSTGDKKAHTYWLRKNRVTARHDAVASTSLPSARDVYAALRASGHASILVPMTNYLSDPRVVYALDIQEGKKASRSAILGITGFQGSHLDMAWQRAGGPESPSRLRVVLERQGLVPPQVPAERITSPPPLRRGRVVTPRHLADYARALAAEGERHEALVRSGLTDVQVARLEQIARELVQIKGVTPWDFPGLRHPSAVLAIPRPLKATDKMYALLARDPPEELVHLAESWAQQSYIERLHGTGVILQLRSQGEENAGRWWLDTTELNLKLDKSAGVEVLRAPRGVPPSRSHAAGVQWVFSIVWIYSRFAKL